MPYPIPVLTEEDRRAIIDVADHLIGRAGRTTLMLALRGSRAQRVLRYQVGDAPGYGYYRDKSDAAVLALVDALIAEGVLCVEDRDGFPLIGYTGRGLELAMRYAAGDWLEALRSQVESVASGVALKLPPAMTAIQERNQNTVLLLVDLVAAEADVTWLPLLKAWGSSETRRVRGRLASVVTALERQKSGHFGGR